jgi:hypothetical protein
MLESVGFEEKIEPRLEQGEQAEFAKCILTYWWCRSTEKHKAKEQRRKEKTDENQAERGKGLQRDFGRDKRKAPEHHCSCQS